VGRLPHTIDSQKEVDMTITYLATKARDIHRCPNCGSTNWLRDDSDVDGIQLNTVPPSKNGSLGCNNCGHSWRLV
jgi:predicted RNA-binding Zn-ribbon protein involved in translation (DUF1610 family)